MINKERMELFAAALESDRFKQCRGTLRTRMRDWSTNEPYERHCALGVMTQVALDNGLAEQIALEAAFHGYTSDGYVFSNGGALDPLVADWYGFQEAWSHMGLLEGLNPTLGLDRDGQRETIAGFNDAGTSFWDIAQMVRAKWLKDES